MHVHTWITWKVTDFTWILPPLDTRRYSLMVYKPKKAGHNKGYGLRLMKDEHGHLLDVKARRQVVSVNCNKLPGKILLQLAVQCHCQLEKGVTPDKVRAWKDAMLRKMTSV